MIRVGLTGSIAMGKSEVAKACRAMGLPVHDADAAVHDIYQGDAARRALQADFAEAVTPTGIDRQRLAALVLGQPERLRRLEALVHPLVGAAEQRFLTAAEESGASLVVLDIPLLFETGRETDMDATVVVSASESDQRRRALERPGMSVEKLDAILARQMPDAEKRKRATHVIVNDGSLEQLANRTRDVIEQIRRRHRM